MKIGFIGAGKVGFSLGQFFVPGGLPVTGYYSRHRGSAQEAAAWTGTKQYESLESLVRASDALFLTVPDGAIASVFAQLREFDLAGKQICHCSGALTAREAFPGVEETGAGHYSIHPLFPLCDKTVAWRELQGAFFCLEGHGPHLDWWAERLASLGARVRILPSRGKEAYHAACTVASNLMCALVQESVALLRGCGFSQREALDALAPLMKANLAHLLQVGPQQALTGPVERGDTATVAKHLACLTGEDARQVYRGASRMLVELARNKHPDIDAESMNEILKEGSNR